jgi:hypothetical protein
MEFTSVNPSVVRSVKQRDMLNAWLRALGKFRALPALGDYRPDRIADELADMMGFDVEGSGDNARFLITQEGSRLTATYGNEHSIPTSGPTAISTMRSGPRDMRAWSPLTALAWREDGRPIRFRWCRIRTARTFPMSGCCCRSDAAIPSSRSSAPTRPSASRAASRSTT